MLKYNPFINGGFAPPRESRYFPTSNPYSGEVWAEVARCGPADVDDAVAAALAAFENSEWSEMTPSERGRLLCKFADRIEDNARRLAETEVQDNGKLFAEMSGQTAYLPQWFRYFGGLADKIEGAVLPTDKAGVFNYTVKEPVGVVAMITPWNSPLLLLAWKLAPALAAGATVVIKPSEFTSASTLELMKIASDVGFPPGVINVVTGFGNEVGEQLVRHPDISKVAFTGSDAAGAKIAASAGSEMKRVTLELGGKSPNIVFADADLDAAAPGVVSGIFAATGQTCLAGSRLLVDRRIQSELVERIVDIVKEAKLGDPMDAATNIGPVATKPQFEKILQYIQLGKASGASCVHGGKAYEHAAAPNALFVQPTVFDNVDNSSRLAREEVFGPVLAVIPFENEEEAVSIANDTPYGLAAGVWTEDISRAIRVSEKVKAGTVWVNTYRAVSFTSPFGGMKRSGVGRESGQDAIDSYLETKSVWISTSKSTENPFVLR